MTTTSAAAANTAAAAGRQIRNTGTLGGNIATASPISDLNPLWMAFGANFTLISQERGTRTVPASRFFLAYRWVLVCMLVVEGAAFALIRRCCMWCDVHNHQRDQRK